MGRLGLSDVPCVLNAARLKYPSPARSHGGIRGGIVRQFVGAHGRTVADPGDVMAHRWRKEDFCTKVDGSSSGLAQPSLVRGDLLGRRASELLTWKRTGLARAGLVQKTGPRLVRPEHRIPHADRASVVIGHRAEVGAPPGRVAWIA